MLLNIHPHWDSCKLAEISVYLECLKIIKMYLKLCHYYAMTLEVHVWDCSTVQRWLVPERIMEGFKLGTGVWTSSTGSGDATTYTSEKFVDCQKIIYLTIYQIDEQFMKFFLVCFSQNWGKSTKVVKHAQIHFNY